MLLSAQILLTIVTLGYSVIPSIFDFNETHATNPQWTPHARFHVVWQVCSYDCIALVALWLIWWPSEMAIVHRWLATGLAAGVYAGFFCAVYAKKLYGGANFDMNGVKPFYILGWELDANVSIFTTMVALLAVATTIEASA
jgi:hypothetical protein